MKEINVNSKFGIGEKVYTIWNRSIGFTCPICNGDGAILHKGYKVKCTYCYGSGNVFTHDKMWQVDKEPMTVESMKIAIGKDKKQGIAYTLNNAKKQTLTTAMPALVIIHITHPILDSGHLKPPSSSEPNIGKNTIDINDITAINK